MKKVFAVLFSFVMLLGTVTACGGGSETKSSDKQAAGQKSDLKVAIVLSTGGLGDKNFNDMSYDGLKKAKEEFGIDFDYAEPATVSDFLPNYRMFAETEEYDLIIGLANDQKEAITEISKDFPDQKISLIDAELDLPNVRSIYTKWQEQTFLTGVAAGLATQGKLPNANEENVIGVILGMENPTLQKGVLGFKAGAMYVNPDVEVLTGTVGSFNDPGKAKEMCLSMYNRGADMIQHIAGASGLGLFAAAKESNHYAFGVGGNQNSIEPDVIIATALRNVNEMVFNEVKKLHDGTWEAGIQISGIKEGAVGYDAEGSKVELPQDIVDQINKIKQKIVDGELIPVDDESKLEQWLKDNPYQP